MSELSRLSYKQIAERYNLGSLKVGGDLQLTPDGDLETTVDGDLKLGNDQHNALHRLVARWQFSAPMVEMMFLAVVNADNESKHLKEKIDDIATRIFQDTNATEEWHNVQHGLGIHEYGPEAAAGAITVVVNNLLRREWVDLGKPSTWESAGTQLAGCSFAQVMEAASNNFRHCDEWDRTNPPTREQLKSMDVIAKMLGISLLPYGLPNPFRGNICPEVVLKVTGGSFESLMDMTFWYARSLGGL